MPITTRCQCGARFAAPDKLAGQKVKCPKCDQPVAVPASSAAGVASPRATPGIGVKCKCGKPFKAPDSFAGKLVKCPNCGESLPVPNPSKAAAAALNAAADLVTEEGIGDLLDEADLNLSKTGRRCPECREDLELDDIICVNCGYNTEVGKKIKVQKVERGKRIGNVTLSDLSKDGKPDAPAEVQSLVKLLNQAGTLAVLIAVGIVAFSAYQKMQADPNLGTDAILTVLTGKGAWILGGAVALVTAPCAVAANLVQNGNAVGRILSIVMGFVTIPVFLLGALILKLAFSDDVSRYCR